MLKKITMAVIALLLSIQGGIAADPAADLTAQAMKAYAARNFEESLKFFEQAIAAGATDSSTLYNAACSAALAGKSDAALDLLSRSVAAGFANPAQIGADPDLKSLAGSPRLAEIVATAEAAKAKRERFWSSPAITAPYSERLSEDERIAGLSRAWAEAKFNFVHFDKVPDLDWDALYLSYLPRVRAAESTLDYYKVLMSFLAQLKDGHTAIRPPREIWSKIMAVPPLRIQKLEARYIVAELLDPALAGIDRGMEIVAVDGMPVTQHAEKNVAPYQQASTPQDLDARTARDLLWGAEGSSVELTLVDTKGRTVKRAVTRMDRSKFATTVPPFEYRALPGNIAYVALNEFGDAKAAEGFEAKLDEIAKATALIIDVRQNGGGNSSNGYRVLSALTDKPFATSRWSTALYKPVFRAWGRPPETYAEEADQIPPGAGRHFTGRVVVLTSASTYSAAEDFTVAFDAMKRGTIIGEPTGGSTGQPLMFKLPGGGAGYVCSKRDTYPDGKEFVGVGIQPQIVVRPTVDDLRAGKDRVLEEAVKYLKSDAGR